MILKFTISLLLLVFFVLGSETAHAQWQRTSGPEGGVISAIVADGTTLYSATGVAVSSGLVSAGDVYRSTDLGNTWTSIGADIPGNAPVYCLGVNAKAIYCGTRTGLYRRMKDGVTWDSISLAGDRVQQLVISDTEIIAYMGFYGVFRSTDDGKTWTNLHLGNIKNAQINAIDRNGSDLFLATQGQGILFSSDNGVSWEVRNDKITGEDEYVSCLYHLNGREFAGTLRGVYFTTDHGVHWDSVRSGLPSEFGPSAFASDGSILYATISSMGMYFSADLGVNWKLMGTGIPEYSPTSALAVCSGNIYSGIGQMGVMRAPLDTKIWQKATFGISNTSVFGIRQFNVSGIGNAMFAGTLDNDFGQFWRTASKGVVWSVDDSLSHMGVIDFEEKDDIFFAGTSGDGLFISSDGGRRWKPIISSVPGGTGYINSITKTPTSVVAAIMGNVGILRTTDLGQSWTAPLLSASASIHKVFYDSLSRTLFAGSDFGIFVSQDDGETWIRPKTAIDSLTIYSFARVGNILLAGTWFGLYESTDNGATWSLADPSTKKVRFNALHVIGSDVYAAVHGDVLISQDKGSHWQSFQSGLPKDVDVNSLSNDDMNIYAGTNGYGVMRTPLPSVNSVGNISSAANILTTMYSADIPSLHYLLSAPAQVHLKLVSAIGENILTLSDEFQSAGSHEYLLTDPISAKIATGLYFAVLEANGTVHTSKILVRK